MKNLFDEKEKEIGQLKKTFQTEIKKRDDEVKELKRKLESLEKEDQLQEDFNKL